MKETYFMTLRGMVTFTCLLGSTLPTAVGVKILLMPFNAKSHYAYFGPLAMALKNEGHNVTIGASCRMELPSNLAVRGIQRICYKSLREPAASGKEFSTAVVKAVFEGGFSQYSVVYKKTMKISESQAADSFEDEGFMQQVQKATFDIAVTEPLGHSLVLPYKLGIPSVSVASECLLLRIPDLPTYVPHMSSPYSDRMNFKERFLNFLLSMTINSLIHFGFSQDAFVRKYVPEKPALTFTELSAKQSLCFRLRNYVVDYVRPSMPNIIEIPDIIVKPGKPLPEDILQQIGKRDTILVSFGSWIDVALPENVGSKLFEAFSKTKYTVLWKYTGKIAAQYSANVKIHSWLPQNDILADQNVKLFITHGGISSMVEAVSHGVPMILFPFMGDQSYDAHVAESNGYGIVMKITDFTVDELVESIEELMNSQKYRENVKTASTILKNPPIPAGKKASYWITHVVKYGDRHIRSAAFDLSLPQYFMLDIVGTLLILLIIICLFTFFTVKLIYRILKLILRKNFVRKTKEE